MVNDDTFSQTSKTASIPYPHYIPIQFPRIPNYLINYRYIGRAAGYDKDKTIKTFEILKIIILYRNIQQYAQAAAIAPEASRFFRYFLINKHAVAVAVKSVFVLYCRPVSVKYKIFPRKRTHEHKKGRFRKMKICYKFIDNFKFIRGINKKP